MFTVSSMSFGFVRRSGLTICTAVLNGRSAWRIHSATASTAALEGAARNSHYGASKGAVTAYVRALAVELARLGRNVPFAYNRKEAKDHGEGGTIVGAKLEGRVVIIDDVISAGTSVRESVQMIRAQGAIVGWTATTAEIVDALDD